MKLYEIDQAIENCIDQETGEIVDVDAFYQLQMEREKKLENVALYIKNLSADAVAIDAEMKALKRRKESAEKAVENLKSYLLYALQGQKFSTPKVAVSFRTSEAVSITDESIIQKKYLVKKISYIPDKTAIKEALKKGIKVKGAVIETRLNAQVK